MLAVFQLSLEVGSASTSLADGLDGYSLACGLVLSDPRSAVGAFAGLSDEGVSLIEAGLVSVCVVHICHLASAIHNFAVGLKVEML